MAERQVRWARQKRAQLIEELGGCCAECGTREKLELDCKRPMGDKHHKMGFTARTSFYNQQHAQGNLQVLCQYHNATKGDSFQPF